MHGPYKISQTIQNPTHKIRKNTKNYCELVINLNKFYRFTNLQDILEIYKSVLSRKTIACIRLSISILNAFFLFVWLLSWEYLGPFSFFYHRDF